MNKQGNQNSPLLDSFLKIAAANPPKAKSPFTVSASVKQPTIEDIFKDVLKIGKNIKRTAQIPTELGTPEMSPEMSGDPELGEGMLGTEEELGSELGEVEADTEGAKQGLVDALIALCGGAEQACECITSLSAEGSPEGEMPELEPGMEGGLGDEIGGEAPVDEPMSDMASPMAAPASPMPMM